jgi:hypothetical protein
MNFYPFSDIETMSPRPMLFITGDVAHSREFSEDAFRLAAEPRSCSSPTSASIRVNLIPRDSALTQCSITRKSPPSEPAKPVGAALLSAGGAA